MISNKASQPVVMVQLDDLFEIRNDASPCAAILREICHKNRDMSGKPNEKFKYSELLLALSQGFFTDPVCE